VGKILVDFIFTLGLSIAIILLILLTTSYHSHLSHDALNGVQKYHKAPTARIGGLAIYLSFAIIVIWSRLSGNYNHYSVGILFGSFIIFLVGILEDVTKRLSPAVRMLGFLSGVYIVLYITRSTPVILHTDFVGLDNLISQHEAIGMGLSIFAIIGLTNAYNVIDGYNGLSSTTALINLMGLWILAYLLSDLTILWTISYLIAATLGFWLFNYPRGKIFLGDGGAYLLGFTMAVMSIYLVEMHHGFISPYAVLLLNIYPVTEIGFSIYRRKLIHTTEITACDNFHLHQLIYHRCVPIKSLNRNARVLPLMLYFIVPQVILALVFYTSTALCLFFVAVYIVFYVFSYFCLLKFKTLYFLKVMLKHN
jgi:UDP-GlcNAc:undecaprenyl-phosphate/decaprenyl-phosphate GlcNAc-1-phosphate transferase